MRCLGNQFCPIGIICQWKAAFNKSKQKGLEEKKRKKKLSFSIKSKWKKFDKLNIKEFCIYNEAPNPDKWRFPRH